MGWTKLVTSALLGAVLLSGNVAAQTPRIVYDPPMQFSVDAEATCPDELRVSVDSDDGLFAGPAMKVMCRPVFKPVCLVVPFQDETAAVLFDVDASGKPNNVRLTSTTNACLNNYAALSVALSEFAASPGGARDLSRTIRFQFDKSGWEKFEEPLTFEFGGHHRCGWRAKGPAPADWRSSIGLSPEIVSRCEPDYPSRCQNRAKSWEGVLVYYDVAPDGSVENVRVPAATNKCFAKNAAKAVAIWRYAKSEKTWRNLSAVLSFQLANY